jgi:hypothetical protein
MHPEIKKLKGALYAKSVTECSLLASTYTAPKTTPLKTLLYIYTLAGRDSYINYLAGAKALVQAFSPIEIPSPIPVSIPSLLVSYETKQLAVALVEDWERVEGVKLRLEDRLERVEQYIQAIVAVTYTEIIPLIVGR